MVKISFGLLKPKNVEKEITDVNNKLTGVFSKLEDTSKKNVKKELITELSFSFNNSENKNDEINKYVIPCKNSLKNLKDVNVTYEQKKKVTEELKYGLNIIYETNDNKLEEKDSKFDGKDTSLDDSLEYNDMNANKRPLEDISKPSEDNKEDDVAKKIIEELEKNKLREKLFGSQLDLIDRYTKTTPILLRSNKNKVETGGHLSKPEDLKEDDNVDIKSLLDVKMEQYENVPVENFGLAMLLGMGYDPKKNDNKPKVYKKRVFERAGLGADSVMKTNMECLMDANLMSKLKRNHVYNIVDGTTSVTNWALPGIVVKITDKNHENYKHKGIVKSIEKNMVYLIVQGKEIKINFKHLETVVTIESKLCKVVRRIPNNNKKDYIQIGTLVKVIDVNEEHARVIFEEQELVVSLDSISQVQE